MILNAEISVIIPTNNEDRRIRGCLESLSKQKINKKMEVIIVDDSSIDSTVSVVNNFIINHTNFCVRLFKQKHSGPGVARNLGVKKSLGKVLVFIDGDMIFDPSFIKYITDPIFKHRVVGCDTFSGYLANGDNYWSKCWNIGRFYSSGVIKKRAFTEMAPVKFKNSTIFRAISRRAFFSSGGFDTDGDYSDDESIYKKLRIKSFVENKAVYYHFNPDTFIEVIQRASWIGRGTKIWESSSKWKNFVKYSFPFSVIKGLVIGYRFKYLEFVLFKVIFDFMIWLQIVSKL